MFRITKTEQAIQRAAALEDLRIVSEKNGMTDSIRKQLHDGYCDLVTYWTGINEIQANKFKQKALAYSDPKRHRCAIL